MRVYFRGLPEPSGDKGRFLLEIPDPDEYKAARDFLVKYWKDGKDSGLEVSLEKWYRKRTLDQNNLQWELCTRIAKADQTSKEIVHEAMKAIVYETEEHYGAWIPIAGAEHTTVEYAEAIQWLMNECMVRPDPIDIHDIWVLFTHWRYGLEQDPVHYKDLDEYRDKHPCCESCGKMLLETDEQGIHKHVGHMHHIKSRGSGGLDEAFNILMLCGRCHQGIHKVGVEVFCERVPHLALKIRRVLGNGHGQGPDLPVSEGAVGEGSGEEGRREDPGDPVAGVVQPVGAGDSSGLPGPTTDGDRGPAEEVTGEPAGSGGPGGTGREDDPLVETIEKVFKGVEIDPATGDTVDRRDRDGVRQDAGADEEQPGPADGPDRRMVGKREEMLGRLHGLEHAHERHYPPAKEKAPTPEEAVEANEELGLF